MSSFNSQARSAPTPALLGVFFISMSLILFEILLVKITTFISGNSIFPFFVILFALLGLGASGLTVFAFHRHVREEMTGKYLYYLSLLCAISIFCVSLILYRHKTMEYSLADIQTFIPTAMMSLLSLIPFYLGGLCIMIAFAQLDKQIHRVFSLELLGSAVGAVLIIPIINFLGTGGAIGVAAGAALIGNGCFKYTHKNKLIHKFLYFVFLILLVFSTCVLRKTFFRYANDGEHMRTLFHKENAAYSVSVQENSDNKNVLTIRSNNDQQTRMFRFEGSFSAPWLPLRSIYHIAYDFITPGGAVLSIGVGGGQDVLAALAKGHKITGVDLNSIIINDIMKEKFSSFNGDLYHHPDVTIYAREAREFLRNNDKKYNLVQLGSVSRAGATGTALHFSQSNLLYTTEAFVNYFSHLADDGILTITRPYNESQIFNLISLTVETMRNLSVLYPERHMAFILDEENHLFNCMIKKTEFNEEEHQKMQALAKDRHFKILYDPWGRQDKRIQQMMHYIKRGDHVMGQRLFGLKTFLPIDSIEPFLYMRSFNLNNSDAQKGKKILKLCAGALGIIILLMVASVAYFLMRRRRASSGEILQAMVSITYFWAIGLAFMLIEFVLVKTLILFLGSPVYSVSCVIFAFLASCAFGSFISHKTKTFRLRAVLQTNLIVCVCILAILPWVLKSPFIYTVKYDIFVRYVFSIGLILPLGLCMGAPLPLGLRLWSGASKRAIPYFLGLDLLASVLGMLLGGILSLFYGSLSVLLLGIIGYVIAASCVLMFSEGSQKTPCCNPGSR